MKTHVSENASPYGEIVAHSKEIESHGSEKASHGDEIESHGSEIESHDDEIEYSCCTKIFHNVAQRLNTKLHKIFFTTSLHKTHRFKKMPFLLCVLCDYVVLLCYYTKLHKEFIKIRIIK